MGLDFLKNPLYNAIISGIIIYILIKVSNKGDPVLGAILSSLPIGVISLLAINKQNKIQNFYIRSEIITNIIIIIMWIAINIMILYMTNIKHVSIIAILLWIGLSVIFYYTAYNFLNHRY